MPVTLPAFFKKLMPAGRPPIWDNPEAFEKAVKNYFETEEVPTWTGLALHLGFDSRSSLQNYKEKPEFLHPIKIALLKMEQIYEKRLNQSKNPTGAIFALKNFGWKDKQEIQQSGGINITFAEPEEYKRLYPTQDQGGIGDLDSDQ